MFDLEEWAPIEDFEPYLVSNHGNIRNGLTYQMKAQSINNRGIPSVLMYVNHRHVRKTVSSLVAEHWVEYDPRPYFDTIINKDGNRLNNRADNLAYRPRGFAIRYHRQFENLSPFAFRGPIINLETNEYYATALDCITDLGIMERDLLLACNNGTPIFPVHQRFEFIG